MSSDQVIINQSQAANIATGGSLLIAFQTAVRCAIIERNGTIEELEALVARVVVDINAASTEGFSAEDAMQGKKQAIEFVRMVEKAIRAQLLKK